MIVENIIAQMLVANGKSLYFYLTPAKESNKDKMEIDFFDCKGQNNIYPIEVKSGKNYTLSSLKNSKIILVSKYQHHKCFIQVI